MKKFIAKKIFTFGYWFLYFASLIDGSTARDMLLFITGKLTKKCAWCEIAGEPDDENRHEINEVGGIDYSTGQWICDDCCSVAETVEKG